MITGAGAHPSLSFPLERQPPAIRRVSTARGSTAGVPEPSVAPLSGVVLIDLDELHMLDCLDHQLSDPLSPSDLEVLGRIGVDEQHLQFASVTGVDEPRGVETCHAVFQREPAARLDEPRVAIGDGNGDAGGDERPLAAGAEQTVLPCQKVDACITLFRIAREWQVRV